MEITSIYIYLSSIFGFLTLVFVLSLIKKDNSIMDIAYGPTFALAAATLLWLHPLPYSLLQLTVAGCVFLWATRLSIRIARKNLNSPEDARYAAWRKAWSKKGRWYFIVRSYVQIYLLQGAIIAVVGLPILLSVLHTSEIQLLQIVGILIGAVVFATGLAIETIADLQLDRFIKNKKAGTIDEDLMTTGLFRYSRRPNYFGEATIWVGLTIIVLPSTYGWLALCSPILITYIMTRITGPMLEQIFLEKFPEKYRNYMNTTSYFIPLPPTQ